MTNGEKFQQIFAVSQVDECDLNVYAWLPSHEAIEIPLEWWNANYSEIPTGSTTKNDLEVDCVSRKAVLDAIDVKAWEFCDYLISKGRNDEQKPVSHFADNLRECVREALPSIKPQEPRWILVSERLPKIADVYLVTRYYPNNVMNPKYIVDACCFDGSNTWYNDNRINHERAYANNVIAWQENPEPYEPQESEVDNG